MKILILIALLISFSAGGQTPSFDAQTNILKLPELRVGVETVYTNVQLSMPPGKAWSLFSIGTARSLPADEIDTTSAPGRDFSALPSTLAGNVQQPLSFVVVGGTPPYQAVSTNPAIFTVAALNHTSHQARASGILQLTNMPGEAAVVITDAASTILLIPVTSAALATVSGPPASPIALSVMPQEVLASTGQAFVLSIAGGATSYQVTSSNPALAVVRAVTLDPDAARATAIVDVIGTSGVALITIADRLGSQVFSTINTAVATQPPGPVSTAPLSAAPASGLSGSYGNLVSLVVSGGALPYRVESSNTAIAMKWSQDESMLTASATIKLYITGTSGHCTINISDAAGTLISVPLSVE